MKDAQLSPHFSFFELTVTSNAALQADNRDVTPEELEKLRHLASDLCEPVRELCGGTPVRVHSGRRSPAVNGATKGASTTSQHPRCEAIDFDVPGQSVEDTFTTLLAAARGGRFHFGQLILEAADRGYKNEDGTESVARWVHCSVAGTLAPERVGQVMKANWNAERGKFDYVLMETVRWPAP